LIYQLAEADSHFAVRVQIAQPRLQALRLGKVTAPDAMHVSSLAIPACGNAKACPLFTFRSIIARAVPADWVASAEGLEPPAH